MQVSVDGAPPADGSAPPLPPVPPGETGAPPAVPPTPPPAEAPPAPPAPPAPIPRIGETQKKSKLDLTAAVTEFGKDGKISEDTYKAAEAKGLDRADVDTFVAGHKARADNFANTLTEIAGSRENLEAVIDWAKSNTDDAQREAFNTALDKADSPTAKLMLRGLMAEYQDAVGSEGQRVTGGSMGKGVIGFASAAEMAAAMSDPRYSRKPDRAYQEMVYKKVVASTF